jgi:hypothetical protein
MPSLGADAGARWPSFVELATARSIAAVFSFPLIVHGANVGVLSAYQRAEGALTLSQRQDGLALVGILAQTILSLQQPAISIGDVTLGDLTLGEEGMADVVAYRAELYQASGMVAIQLRIPAAEALLRIRAHAFASGLPVGAVAAEIVARRLRLQDDQVELEGRS